MWKIFRFFVFCLCFDFVFCFLYICFLCRCSGRRMRMHWRASASRRGFPSSVCRAAFEGTVHSRSAQSPLSQSSFLFLFYVPNPSVHWARISEPCGPIRRLFGLSQIVVPENMRKRIVLKKEKKKKESSPKTKQEQLL